MSNTHPISRSGMKNQNRSGDKLHALSAKLSRAAETERELKGLLHAARTERTTALKALERAEKDNERLRARVAELEMEQQIGEPGGPPLIGEQMEARHSDLAQHRPQIADTLRAMWPPARNWLRLGK